MHTDSIHSLLAAATEVLTPVSDSPRLDAELLLARALERERSYLRAWPGRVPEPTQAERFHALLARRLRGEPVAHILGSREFWSLPLKVTPDTLVPRPDTELLVELALRHIPPDRTMDIADLGTGSGAIALAIARERPTARILATDRSSAALAVARYNAEALGMGNVRFREADWFDGLTDLNFNVIVSNPPYIPEADPHLSRGDARFDPRTALASGPEGLDDLHRIITEARRHLAPGGWLLVEHGYDQGAAVTRLFTEAGYEEVLDHRDLAGHGRVTEGRWQDPPGQVPANHA